MTSSTNIYQSISFTQVTLRQQLRIAMAYDLISRMTTPPPSVLAPPFSENPGGCSDRAHYEGAQDSHAHDADERTLLTAQVPCYVDGPEEARRVPHRARLPRKRPQQAWRVQIPCMTPRLRVAGVALGVGKE